MLTILILAFALSGPQAPSGPALTTSGLPTCGGSKCCEPGSQCVTVSRALCVEGACDYEEEQRCIPNACVPEPDDGELIDDSESLDQCLAKL